MVSIVFSTNNFVLIIWSVLANSAWRTQSQDGHSERKLVEMAGMRVQVLPALHDNYMYLIIDEETKEAAVVDPVDPNVVMDSVEDNKVKLTKILTTHHHWDHASGNKKMKKIIPELLVYGGDDRVEALTNRVGHGDKLNIGKLDVECLFTPCHTKGHICYVVKPPGQPQAVFTGDTLFIAGCGRFFEGSPQEMYDALYNKLGRLPNDTQVFCGHEYTIPNLKFAEIVDSSNRAVAKKMEWAEQMRKENKPTVPSTIGEEKEINPFMRVHTKPLQWRADSEDPIKTMGYIRSEKDNFRA